MKVRPIAAVVLVGVAAIALAIALASWPWGRDVPSVRVFHAAGFSPFIRQVRDECERDLHIKLETEGSGSQEACRKITSLGRTCDVLVLADNQLVKQLLGGVCSWRIDFATDEVVLGVGVRAPHVEQAERDWPEAVLRDDVRLARVDENLGPIGYRTLLALKLQERIGPAGLYDRFLTRCPRKADDVERLAPLLKTGEIDYAFVYRSTCVAHAIRYIELDKRINLGSPDVDYGQVEVRFAKLKSGREEMVTVRGSPAVWALAQPEGGERRDPAVEFVKYLLARQTAALDAVGFRPIVRPRFYGPAQVYGRFAAVAEYAGEMK